MKQKLSILFVLILSSCSSVEFTDLGSEPVEVGMNKSLSKVTTLTGKCESYLWGKFPDPCMIDFSEVLKSDRLVSPGFLKISQEYSAIDTLKTLLSFGLYSSSTYEISVYSKEEQAH